MLFHMDAEKSLNGLNLVLEDQIVLLEEKVLLVLVAEESRDGLKLVLEDQIVLKEKVLLVAPVLGSLTALVLDQFLLHSLLLFLTSSCCTHCSWFLLLCSCS